MQDLRLALGEPDAEQSVVPDKVKGRHFDARQHNPTATLKYPMRYFSVAFKRLNLPAAMAA
jgi:hypothetical protein